MLKYDLGEMKCKEGVALRYEVERITFDYVLRISDIITSSHAYKEVAEKMPSQRVMLYFQYSIKKEIFPFVRQACVIQWYRRAGKHIPLREQSVSIPREGILPELENCWSFEDVPLVMHNRAVYYVAHAHLLKKKVRDHLRKFVVLIKRRLFDTKKNYCLPAEDRPRNAIACHYAEGLDASRRNDLCWYAKSGIKPEKVLIYFDKRYNTPYVTKGVIRPMTLIGEERSS
ncbi:MAG: hypothetical protein ABID09_04480 [Candidatus Omnitrophota bacterium]